MSFTRPNTVGKENYVEKFTDVLLEGAIDTELPLDEDDKSDDQIIKIIKDNEKKDVKVS